MSAQKVTLEVCVDCLESVEEAVKGGAHRLELCSALSKGGLTPTTSLLRVIKKRYDIPVFCMVRPRGGPMVFSKSEEELILEETNDLKAAGADGIVFGALTLEGGIDVALCQKVKQAAGSLPCTFHRAFDLLSDPKKSVATIIGMNYQRILTSGCRPTAMEGAQVLQELVESFGEDISFMAGGGVNSANVAQLRDSTGIKEVHGSAKRKKVIKMVQSLKMGSEDDNEVWVTSASEVAAILKNLQ